MSANSSFELPANVIFDTPAKYWGGEWYFLQNRPLNLAQLAINEYHAIQSENHAEAIKWLYHLAPKADPAIDLKHLQKLYEDPGFDQHQIKHLHGVFEQANRFSLALLHLFQLGFNPGYQRLEISKKYPPVHVNKTLARQMSRDLLILETAFSQRQRSHFDRDVGDGKTAKNTVTVEGHLLHMADLLAYDSLKPLKARGDTAEASSIIPEETVAITYMRERINIRLIPYYPLVLIGIPTALSNDWYKPPLDFLIIPHEVGHYLYQHGSFNGKIVQEELSDRLKNNLGITGNSDWRKRWLEEIFADCYSVLIAGPVAILAYQEMLTSRQLEDLDDELGTGEHPIAVLRPLILTNFLRQLNSDNIATYRNSPDLLDEHWHNYLANYNMLEGTSIQNERHKILCLCQEKPGS